MIFTNSNDFVDLLREVVRDEITKALKAKEEKYYTREKASEILNISLSTIDRMIRRKELKIKKVGARVNVIID